MKTRIIAAAILMGMTALTAAAAEKRALYDRAEVSVGALSARASAVVTARVISQWDAEGETMASIVVETRLKGETPPLARVTLDEGARLCAGEHLAFLNPKPDGSFILLGGDEFGWVHLEPADRELILQTAAAHATGDLKAKAKAAATALQGSSSKLLGDVAVDLFREPALVALLDDKARTRIAGVIRTSEGRNSIPGEWHYLAVSAGRIGDADAVSALLAAVRDRTCLPRVFALGRAFAFVGPEGREALLQAFESQEDESALPGFLAVCAEIRLAQAVPRVLALADSGDAVTRKFALVAAGDIGGPEAIAFLGKALKDEGRPLIERKLAVVALAANTEPAGIQAIVAAEGELSDADLVGFIKVFRKFPARERLNLLRSALGGK